MKTLFAFVFVGSITLAARGQTDTIDSLRTELANAKADTTQIRIMAELGAEWIYLQTDSAYLYLNRANQQALSLDYHKGVAISLNYLGRYYQQVGDYSRALKSFLDALKVKIDPAFPKIHVITLLDLGKLYSAMRMYSGAEDLFRKEISYYHKSLAAFHGLKGAERDGSLKNFEASINVMMGQAYANRQIDSLMLDSAAYYFRAALEKANGNSRQVEILALDGLASTYFQREKYSEAQQTGKLLLAVSRQESPDREVMALQKVAHFFQRTSFDSAYFYLQQALEKAQSLSASMPLQEIVWGQIGQLHFHHQHYRKAIDAFSRERALAKASGSKVNEIGYLLTSEAYAALGDYKQAFQFKTLYHNLMDSLFNTETSARLEKLEADFAAERQRNEMLVLQQDATAKTLLLQKQQNRQIIFVFLIILLLLAAAVVYYRVRVLQKTKNAQEQLFKQLDELKSRFFANISHEFRTPLTLLMAPLQKRLQTAGNPDDKTEFQMMFRNADRLLTLVNQLLELARFDAGTQQLRVTEQDLVAFLQARASEFQPLAISQEIHFSFHHDNAAVPLLFDADKVHKIINNLLSNAFKFTPAGGQVQLKLQTLPPSKTFRAGSALITVADTGPGIGEEHLPHLFDRFYQVDSSPRLFEGSGVGLALAKELTELHKGKISVQSQWGVGTTFSVELPLGKTHLPVEKLKISVPITMKPIPETADIEYTLSSNNENSDVILVIEDHTDLRAYLCRELGKRYVVLQSSDGEEGLKVAVEKVPSLILCDWMMPGLSGPEVCVRIRQDERTSHIPFILLTAKAELPSRIEGLRQGADDFITKPFSHDELFTRIENLIESRKRLQKRYSLKHQLIKSGPIEVESMEERFIKKAVAITEAHIENTDFSVEAFAEEMALSQVQLYRKLTALTGLTPNEFIRELRLQRAAQLLSQRVGNVAEIGYQCGFNNLSYFARVFKEKYGVTPSEFRKKEVPRVDTENKF